MNKEHMNHKASLFAFFKKFDTYLLAVGLAVVCMLLSPNFFTWSNVGNLISQNAGNVFVALGMLTVILAGGIDLSIGSVVAFTSVLSAYLLKQTGMSLFLVCLITLAASFVIGVFSGALVAYAKLPAFVATLSLSLMCKGAAYLISEGGTISYPHGTLDTIASIKFFSWTPALGKTIGQIMPLLGVIAAVAVLLIWFVQRYTSYGRLIMAIGSNVSAVRLSGVNVKTYTLSTYAVSAVCSGIAGILSASRAGVGAPTIGLGWEMNAVAACVIGGASLSGGSGSVFKVTVGVFVYAFITNIMNLTGVASYPQDIIKGLIIIVAVLLQNFNKISQSD